MTPFFSVIISVFNKAPFIKETLNSVINQTFTDFEIIVINDGSTDQSLSVINSIKDKRLRIISQDNKGASAARNMGIEVANGDYIALLDGDDLWLNYHLENYFKTIQKFPEQYVLASAIAHKYGDSIVPVSYSFIQKEPVEIRNFFNSSIRHTILTSSSIVFKKECIEKTGYFDTSIISGQDTDLWIRMGLNYSVLFMKQISVYYVYDSKSLSNTTYDVNKKPKYDKYDKEEKENLFLKAFLDRNRYSMAILSRLQGDHESFSYYRSALNTDNISFRKRLLLSSPKWALKLLLKLKSIKGEKIYYPEN